MEAAAQALWVAKYTGDWNKKAPGLLQGVIARAAPQTLRLAVIYALLDHSTVIAEAHMKAAIAFWDFCLRSAAYLFGDLTGDDVADTFLRALRVAGAGGLTRKDLWNELNRHTSASRMSAALEHLLKSGQARAEKTIIGNNLTQRWFIQP